MDKIIIKDFEVFGNHGVFEEEKRLGQKFVLSIGRSYWRFKQICSLWRTCT